jgi:hypothetical protein
MIPEPASTFDNALAVFDAAGAAAAAVAIKGITASARASFVALLMPGAPYRSCFGFFGDPCRLGGYVGALR